MEYISDDVVGFVVDSSGVYYKRNAFGSVFSGTDLASWDAKVTKNPGKLDIVNDILVIDEAVINDTPLWFSSDSGDSWQNTLTHSSWPWAGNNIAVSPEGTIYIGEYSGGTNQGFNVSMSEDGAQTWDTVDVRDFVGEYLYHIHVIYPVSDTEIYMGVGDYLNTSGILKSIDQGQNWEMISSFDRATGILKVNGTFFLGTDSSPYGIWKTTDWETWENLFIPRAVAYAYKGGWVQQLKYDSTNEVIYAGIKATASGERSAIWFSPDEGEHWGQLWDTGTNVGIERIFLDDYHDRIWVVLNNNTLWGSELLTQDTAKHLIGKYHNGYVFDGATTFVSTYESPMVSPTLRVTGVGVENLAPNAIFDSLDGWAAGGSGSELNSTVKLYGNNSLKVSGSSTGSRTTNPRVSVDSGAYYTFSVYMKTSGNTTDGTKSPCYVTQHNSVGTLLETTQAFTWRYNASVDWVRLDTTFVTLGTTASVAIVLRHDGAEPDAIYYFDGVMLTKTQITMPFVQGDQSSVAGTLTLNGQGYSIGTLNDEEYIDIGVSGVVAGNTILSGTFTGSCVVSAAFLDEAAITADGILFMRESSTIIGICDNTNDTDMVTWHSAAALDISDWLGGSYVLSVSSVNDVVVAFNTTHDCGWLAVSAETVEYGIFGLTDGVSYRVYQEDAYVTYGDGPAFEFLATGTGTFYIDVWYDTQVSSLVVMTVNMIGLGILVSIMGAMAIPYARDIKKGKQIQLDRMFKDVVKSAVFIVVGVAMWVMLHNVIIG